jgi:hypothetical protein
MPDLHEDEPAPGGYMLSDAVLDSLPRYTHTPPAGSDGYLDDAEQWGEDRQTLVDYARSSGHGVLPTREVLALLRLDRILGNEHALSARGTGRLRGVVAGALRDWHARQRAIAEQLGPSDPDGGPFPVAPRPLNDREVLDLPDTDPRRHPTSIEAPHLIDLDQHPLALRTYGPGLVTFDGRVLRIEYDGGDYDVTAAPREGIVDGYRRRAEVAEQQRAEAVAELSRKASEWDQRSAEGRAQVEALVEQANGLREQLTAARAERDDARAEVVRLGRALEGEESLVRDLDGLAGDGPGIVDRLRTFVANLAAEDWTEFVDAGARSWLLARPRKIASSIEEVVLGERVDPAEHPARPMPGANAWPDDAVLLTYPEVRRLVALHLDVCRQSMPRERPWEWVTLRANAVRDGEVPLLLAEVLDR